jgi:hypothetical protein
MPEPATAKAHYDALLPEIEAVAETQLVPRNLDVPTAVQIALRSMPVLESLQDRMASLPSQFFDHAKVEKVQSYALAAWYAHLAVIQYEAQGPDKDAMLAEAQELRRLMLLDAEVLAARGFVSVEAVDGIRQGRSHVDTANDLVALASLFEGAWDRVRGRMATTESEIDRAEALGPQLLMMLAQEDSPELSTTHDRAHQAFSLFYNAYEECRRAVAFFRHHEKDVDDIFPSLHTRLRRPRASASSANGATTQPAT